MILGSVFSFSNTRKFLSFKCYSKISTKRILSVNIFLEVFLGESLIKYFSEMKKKKKERKKERKKEKIKNKNKTLFKIF